MPPDECPTCGYPPLRPDGHACWCWSPTRAADEPTEPCRRCRPTLVCGHAEVRLLADTMHADERGVA